MAAELRLNPFDLFRCIFYYEKSVSSPGKSFETVGHFLVFLERRKL